MPEETKLPEEDLKERMEGLSKELIPLLGKYEMGLGCQIQVTPDGRIEGRPVVLSTRNTKKPDEKPSAAASTLSEA